MPDSVTKRFAGSPDSVAQARTFVRATLTSWGLNGHIDDALLCVSELGTTAVRHALAHSGHFLVDIARTDELLRIEVHDTSHRNPQLRHPGASDDNGRGLLIVAAVSDDWGVEQRVPRGKIVWTEFKIQLPSASTTPQPGAL
jgi:hypothetical protein